LHNDLFPVLVGFHNLFRSQNAHPDETCTVRENVRQPKAGERTFMCLPLRLPPRMIIRGMLVLGTEGFSETVDAADQRERGAAFF
jgi:hypothetical protein